jgi:hypothetical protein
MYAMAVSEEQEAVRYYVGSDSATPQGAAAQSGHCDDLLLRRTEVELG